MPFITLKIPQFSAPDLRKRLNTTLDRRGRKNQNTLLRTTQYFETVKPVFQSNIEKVEGDWQVITAPLDDESGKIWTYLDQGTSIRYAWMDQGFAAGTTPGTFETGPTVGDKIGLSMSSPAEGIEARGWTDLLVELEQPQFQNDIGNMLKGWAKSFASGASKIISGE